MLLDICTVELHTSKNIQCHERHLTFHTRPGAVCLVFAGGHFQSAPRVNHILKGTALQALHLCLPSEHTWALDGTRKLHPSHSMIPTNSQV